MGNYFIDNIKKCFRIVNMSLLFVEHDIYFEWV